tara:strand:+ start:1577 stop:1894 length:318 start_codon:yes stop_codon:yes gene_type:complete
MTDNNEYEKLDAKIEKLNSTRVFKKITPKGDLSWYIKWTSSFIILIGMALTSAGMTPYNLFFHLTGVIGWGIVGMLWHDRALIFINGVATFIFFSGIIGYYFGGN